MAHVVWCPDTTGKSGAVYVLDEHGYNSRVYHLGRFVADKVSKEDAAVICAAIRDAEEKRERDNL